MQNLTPVCLPTKQTVRLALVLSWTFLGEALLQGCSPTVPAWYYKSEQQCIQARQFPPETCASDWRQAQTIDQQSVPKYDDLDDCKQDVQDDSCERVSSGGHTFYRPFMRGFIVGDDSNQSGDTIAQPLYGNSRLGLFTVSGSKVTTAGEVRVNIERNAAISPAFLTQSEK